MIAANYRKHPEAMALQMVLPFGRASVWVLIARLRGLSERFAQRVRLRSRLRAGWHTLKENEPRLGS